MKFNKLKRDLREYLTTKTSSIAHDGVENVDNATLKNNLNWRKDTMYNIENEVCEMK